MTSIPPSPVPTRSTPTRSTPARSTLILGALLWAGTMQYFLAESIVISRWTTPYSRSINFISDLGAIHAGEYPAGSGRLISSPWHLVMDGSFILQGLLIGGGALLMRRAFPAGGWGKAGIAMIAASGLGVVLVGVSPEDVNLSLHSLGAGTHFLAGNIGLILLTSLVLRHRQYHRVMTTVAMLLGTLGLVATLSLFTGHHWSLGTGGIERVAAYPLPFGLLVFGACIAADRSGDGAAVETSALTDNR